MEFICVRWTKPLLRKHFRLEKVRGTENSGTAAITRPINWPAMKMNSYRRASFILQLHIWTSVTTVYKLIRSVADWSIDNVPGESGNIRNYSILCFVKLFLSNGRKKKKKKKETNKIEREERKIMENTIKEENSGQWRSSVDTNPHRG